MSTSDGDDVPRDPWGNPLPPEDRAPLNPGPDDFLPPFPGDPPGGADQPTQAVPPAAPANPAWPGSQGAPPAAPPGPPPFAPPTGTAPQAPPPGPATRPAPPANPAWPGDQPTQAVPPPPAPPEPYPGQPYPGQTAPGQAYPGQPGPGWGGPGVPPQRPAYPPGQYPGGGWGPGAPWVRPKRDGMAIGAFVCSLVGLLCFSVVLEPVAVILGIVARKRIRESGGTLTGDGLALAAIIIGAIGFVLGIASMIYLARNPDAFNFDQMFKNLTTTTGG